MEIKLRNITPDDAEECSRIVHEAFSSIDDKHNFRRDFPSVESATPLAAMLINSPDVFGVAAEVDGKFAGSNFLTEWDPIAGVGPITVDPKLHGHGIGRKLMQAVIARGRDHAVGIRLVQDSFNTASLSLYASLGFAVKEPLVLIEGRINDDPNSDYEISPMTDSDVTECDALYSGITGFSRAKEALNILPFGKAFVARQGNRIVAYTTAIDFWPLNHAAAVDENAMKYLLSGASRLIENQVSMLIPSRQAAMFEWLLNRKFRVVKQLMLMAMGSYQDPDGIYFPSVGY